MASGGAPKLLALAAALTISGCWRVDLYPVSTSSVADGGSQDSQSCPSFVLAPGDQNVTLQVGTLTRSFVLHIPRAYGTNGAVPLILDFHGIGGTGASERSTSLFPAVTDLEGVIMAFPDGLKGPIGSAWNIGPCCVDGVDDVAFARSIVEYVRGVACIDSNRVYAVGVLTGGLLAYHLACNAADLFAAVSSAAIDMVEQTVNACGPKHAVTVASFRGTADSHVPYAGGNSALVPTMPLTFLGAKGTFDRWAKIDGCSGGPSLEDSHGCSRYATCQAGAEVVLCTKQGGADDPVDGAVAWPILKRHVLVP
jgi:polyhydroxybutyrate depolymerase